MFLLFAVCRFTQKKKKGSSHDEADSAEMQVQYANEATPSSDSGNVFDMPTISFSALK